jgi:hypothetical protein
MGRVVWSSPAKGLKPLQKNGIKSRSSISGNGGNYSVTAPKPLLKNNLVFLYDLNGIRSRKGTARIVQVIL